MTTPKLKPGAEMLIDGIAEYLSVRRLPEHLEPDESMNAAEQEMETKRALIRLAIEFTLANLPKLLEANHIDELRATHWPVISRKKHYAIIEVES